MQHLRRAADRLSRFRLPGLSRSSLPHRKGGVPDPFYPYGKGRAYYRRIALRIAAIVVACLIVITIPACAYIEIHDPDALRDCDLDLDFRGLSFELGCKEHDKRYGGIGDTGDRGMHDDRSGER